jgi:hypothetical protein
VTLISHSPTAMVQQILYLVALAGPPWCRPGCRPATS